jgi:diaminopimelate decarboxylase
MTAAVLSEQELQAFVRPWLARRETFLAAYRGQGSPLYLFDEGALRARAREFLRAFGETLDDPRVFYAVKSNAHPWIAETLIAAGLGLDVSSGRELAAAVEWGAPRLIFSGPGKTDEELALALRHADRVTILIDSFGELERLGRAADAAGCAIRAGVRLTTEEQGLWRKFGIPLGRLGEFREAAATIPGVRLAGLQFHTSWNLDPSNQVAFLARLGAALQGLPEFARDLEFIDIGGGYWPSPGEWLHAPDGRAQAPEPGSGGKAGQPGTLLHYRRPAASLETFAAHIAQALRIHVFPHCRAQIWLEPGRWLCHDALHILLQVVDRKAPDLVVTDAGTNAIGWERFETDYFPVLNLSQPALSEHPCYVLGSLCTPHDVWGYSYWGSGIAPGDVLLIPSQGAYTYGLRQEFIKPLPRSVRLAPESPPEG